jgi:preprotein translocase subunit YajC
MLVQMAPLVLIGAIFCFLLIRPEQRRRRSSRRRSRGSSETTGWCSRTASHGRVVAIGDKVLSLEVAPKVTVQVDRDAVQRVLTAPSAGEAREKEREKS